MSRRYKITIDVETDKPLEEVDTVELRLALGRAVFMNGLMIATPETDRDSVTIDQGPDAPSSADPCTSNTGGCAQFIAGGLICRDACERTVRGC